MSKEQSQYTYSTPVIIKKWPGGSIGVAVGYVREKPQHNQVVLLKKWSAKGGVQETRFNIAGQEDWQAIVGSVNKLWPELKEQVSSDNIHDAIQKISKEKELLDLLAAYPSLLDSVPKNIDILRLPDTQKQALVQLLNTGSEVAGKIIGQLAKEDVQSLDDFSTVLDALSLATINNLVGHINGRLGFIDYFEKAIHDNSTYERRGETSVHNLLKANMWMVDRNYTVLHDDETLKNIIIEKYKVDIDDPDEKRRPDFVCLSDDHGKVVIIEIKRPSVKLKMTHVTQLLDYRKVLQEYSGATIRDFECILVGRELDQVLIGNPFEQSGIKIVTYTDFIGNARKFYREYSDLVNDRSYSF